MGWKNPLTFVHDKAFAPMARAVHAPGSDRLGFNDADQARAAEIERLFAEQGEHADLFGSLYRDQLNDPRVGGFSAKGMQTQRDIYRALQSGGSGRFDLGPDEIVIKDGKIIDIVQPDKIRRNAVIGGMIGIGGLAGGLGIAAAAGGAGAGAAAGGAGASGAGASGAAGGTLAATQTAPLMGTLPAGGAGLGAGLGTAAGAGAAGTGALASQVTAPTAGTLPAGGTGANLAGAGGAGASVLGRFADGVDASDTARLAAALTPLIASRFGGDGSGAGGSGAGSYPPELQELLAMSLERMRAQQPLFNAINAQALNGLPRQANGFPSQTAQPVDDVVARTRAQFGG